jgi:hypothetical protein
MDIQHINFQYSSMVKLTRILIKAHQSKVITAALVDEGVVPTNVYLLSDVLLTPLEDKVESNRNYYTRSLVFRSTRRLIRVKEIGS